MLAQFPRSIRGLAMAMAIAAGACGGGAPAPTGTTDVEPSVAVSNPSPTGQPTESPIGTPTDLTPTGPPVVVNGSFDVGGRSLYMSCFGSGSPTIILEPGDGDPADEFMGPIARSLSESHLVCLYDRANKGKSDAAPTPRTGRQMADDLHALLVAAGVPGPYLPVGTSLGGMIAYQFSSLYPDDVVAFISINPPPNPEDWLPAVEPRLTPAENAEELAYGTGAGPEHTDQRGWLDVADPPDTMPYLVLDSGTTQCEGDPLCLKVYDIIEAQTKAMAARGAGGRWKQIAGSHQLQLSNADEVRGLIEELASSRP